MSKGNLFDSFFEDKTHVVSDCDLKDVHIAVEHDVIQKFDSLTGYPTWRTVKSKSITMIGICGDEKIEIKITGNFDVKVEGIEKSIDPIWEG